jgi:hypothetical protein
MKNEYFDDLMRRYAKQAGVEVVRNVVVGADGKPVVLGEWFAKDCPDKPRWRGQPVEWPEDGDANA